MVERAALRAVFFLPLITVYDRSCKCSIRCGIAAVYLGISNAKKMEVLSNGSKIIIGKVEGTTSRKGPKQNREYTIISNSGICEINGTEADLRSFYRAVDEKGKEVGLYNVNKDFSKIGIARGYRYSYTNEFTIIRA